MPPEADRRVFFPFERLGLRRNPFGSLSTSERQATLVWPPGLRAVAAAPRIQILGERGYGKTTLLLLLLSAAAARGEAWAYESIPEGHTACHTPLAGLMTFALDEAQRLNWRARWRLRRAQAALPRLLLGSHADMRRALGWSDGACQTFWAADFTTEAHSAAVLRCRIAYFALHPTTAHITLTPDAVAYLWQQYGARLRAMEQFLYEAFQWFAQHPPVDGQIDAAALLRVQRQIVLDG